MISFFKPLRTFLAYSCLVMILVCSSLFYVWGFGSMMWRAALACYLLLFNPCIIGFISYKMQKKYTLSLCRIFLSSVVVFLLMTGVCLVVPLSFTKNIETWIQWGSLAIEATLVFIITAIVVRRKKNKSNHKEEALV